MRSWEISLKLNSTVTILNWKQSCYPVTKANLNWTFFKRVALLSEQALLSRWTLWMNRDKQDQRSPILDAGRKKEYLEEKRQHLESIQAQWSTVPRKYHYATFFYEYFVSLVFWMHQAMSLSFNLIWLSDFELILLFVLRHLKWYCMCKNLNSLLYFIHLYHKV